MQIVAATQPQGPMHLHGVADNLLEALAITACSQPRLFGLLIEDQEVQGRLLDRWVAIASTRYSPPHPPRPHLKMLYISVTASVQVQVTCVPLGNERATLHLSMFSLDVSGRVVRIVVIHPPPCARPASCCCCHVLLDWLIDLSAF